jgi:putative ABC transport system permease protein
VILLESLRIALQNLWANPLRSFLTLIGIAVGIAAVLHVVALGEITRQNIDARLESMGSNVLLIQPGYSRMRGIRTAEGVTNLAWHDAREIESESPVIVAAVPIFSGQATAEVRDQSWRTRATGTTPAHFRVNNDTLSLGRIFSDAEVVQRARVAVIGDTVRSELFGDADPLGANIFVNSQRFEVIGALEAKGESWVNPDDQIFVPITTAQERLFGVDHVSSILAQMRSGADLDEAFFDIESILRRSHRLRDDQDNDFRVRRQDFFESTIQDTNREIANFVLVIAGVSLLVGGLGIANVMLVSVTERIREIGIRRSLGANRLHVLVQFLAEAMVLGVAGGLLGVAGGTAFNRLVIGPHAPLAWDWMIYSFAICAAIGVVAGMYPATRAAYENVLEALRYE